VQKKKEFIKSLGTFVHDPNFNIVYYYAFEKFMQVNKVVLNYSHQIDPLKYIHIYIWFLTYAFVIISII
jgi:hypothetical protein